MTPERFGDLLVKPALLSGQNATELEELIGRFPWCGSLRKLRYEKALLSDNQDEITLWRKRAEPYLGRGARLLKDNRLKETDPARADQHFGFASDLERQENSKEGASITAQEEVTTLEIFSSDLEFTSSAIDTVDWYLHRHGIIMDHGRPKPAPKESFDSYRDWKDRRAKTAWSDLLRLADEKPKSSKKRKKVQRETSPKLEVASETLADLLAAQGHTDKAIRMYQQLALRYPTKKPTFAARIEALQQQHV